MEGPEPFVRAFLAKALDKAGPGQGPAILFATVPHPLETHMAAEFDHDLDRLQDALQQSGYLYDSSWIPWKLHEPRDRFNDDQSEEVAKKTEDGLPGMFRSADCSKDAFLNGVAVFVIAEKPTQGISLAQVTTAVEIAKGSGLGMPPTIRILGPTFSGSFVTLVRMAKILGHWDAKANFIVRSGGVSVGSAACEAGHEISNRLAGRCWC